jgi:MSHA biogenesis protein MshI
VKLPAVGEWKTLEYLCVSPQFSPCSVKFRFCDPLSAGEAQYMAGSILLALFKKKANSTRASIVLEPDSIISAVVRRRPGLKPLLTHCAMHMTGKMDIGLAGVIAKLPLSRQPIAAVITTDDYQLVQVEAPEVLPSELKAAVRWRLRDVINFHIDDAVIDVFEIPDQSRRGQAKMLFAVAARSSAVQRLASALSPLASDLDVIDIPELCLRNLAALLPQDQRGVALLVLDHNHAQLLLTRQGVLYLTRRIDFSRGNSISFDADSTASHIDASALALELQRSLDYYESHFDQTPIADLIIAPNHVDAAKLAESLKNETSLKIGLLDPAELLEIAEGVELPQSGSYLAAIGAALREDEVQL